MKYRVIDGFRLGGAYADVYPGQEVILDPREARPFVITNRLAPVEEAVAEAPVPAPEQPKPAKPEKPAKPVKEPKQPKQPKEKPAPAPAPAVVPDGNGTSQEPAATPEAPAAAEGQSTTQPAGQ